MLLKDQENQGDPRKVRVERKWRLAEPQKGDGGNGCGEDIASGEGRV